MIGSSRQNGMKRQSRDSATNSASNNYLIGWYWPIVQLISVLSISSSKQDLVWKQYFVQRLLPHTKTVAVELPEMSTHWIISHEVLQWILWMDSCITQLELIWSNSPHPTSKLAIIISRRKYSTNKIHSMTARWPRFRDQLTWGIPCSTLLLTSDINIFIHWEGLIR